MNNSARSLTFVSYISFGPRRSLYMAAVAALIIMGAMSICIVSVEPDADHKAVKSAARQKAVLSDRISVYADGRGNPWISLSDGRELIAHYLGSDNLVDALKHNTARPRSLASADFDEDGVPDLVCGYRLADQGIITLHCGNSDSIYPDRHETKQRRTELKRHFQDRHMFSG